MVAHTYNPSTWDAEVRGSWVWGLIFIGACWDIKIFRIQKNNSETEQVVLYDPICEKFKKVLMYVAKP
jgi:hypothetical protein